MKELKEKLTPINLYYIATRYPDAFTSGHPGEKFSQKQAIEAVDTAKEMVNYVDSEFERSSLEE